LSSFCLKPLQTHSHTSHTHTHTDAPPPPPAQHRLSHGFHSPAWGSPVSARRDINPAAEPPSSSSNNESPRFRAQTAPASDLKKSPSPRPMSIYSGPVVPPSHPSWQQAAQPRVSGRVDAESVHYPSRVERPSSASQNGIGWDRLPSHGSGGPSPAALPALTASASGAQSPQFSSLEMYGK
jgi:hypothetical protein